MDESEAREREEVEAATPIFNVYRRGYDPEQVDRYVNDQQRRLDEALHRASESERKLAAAVGQLRELHRRVAVYESEQRTAQPPALDSLGERVQRILQEAWEGAYNLRQEAEREVAEMRDAVVAEVESQREQCARDIEELRQVASQEAADLVDEATRRALAMRDEMDRRRQAYLERVERDRQRAVSQISFLYDQRQLAISELARLQTTIQATVEEMVHSPLGRPAAAISDTAAVREEARNVAATEAATYEEPEPPAAAVETAAHLAQPAYPVHPSHPAGSNAEPIGIDDLQPEDLEVADLQRSEGAADDEEVAAELELDVALEADEEQLAPGASYERPPLFDDRTEAFSPLPGVVAEPETAGYGAEAEIPTGPMEAVGYGYDYGYRPSPGAEQAQETPTGPWSIESEERYSPEAPAPSGVWDEDGEPAPRHVRYAQDERVERDERHGVYDAEEEGWS